MSLKNSRYIRRMFYVLCVMLILPLYLNGQTDRIKLSFSEAIAIGLDNNPEIKSESQKISAANGKYWSGISLPKTEIGISYEFVPLGQSLNRYDEKSIEVSQSFEFPSNYFLRGSKLSAEEEIAVCKLKLIKLGIVNRIKSSYIKVLAEQYKIEAAKENLKISEDFYKKAGIRHSVGEGTNLEKLTAKVQFNEAENYLQVAQNAFIVAKAELQSALGHAKYNPDVEYVLSDSLVFVEYKIDPEQIEKSLDENNQQIKMALLDMEIASLDKSLAWSSILPDFNLAYFKQARDGKSSFYGASFGISVPVWFMFDQRGKIQEANANEHIMESDLQALRNEILLNLKTDFADYDNNLNQVKLYLNEILPQAEEIYRTAIKSYDTGELTFLEYLQAKQILINSRHNYVSALFSYYQSIFRIEEISGINIIEKSEAEL